MERLDQVVMRSIWWRTWGWVWIPRRRGWREWRWCSLSESRQRGFWIFWNASAELAEMESDRSWTISFHGWHVPRPDREEDEDFPIILHEIFSFFKKKKSYSNTLQSYLLLNIVHNLNKIIKDIFFTFIKYF